MPALENPKEEKLAQVYVSHPEKRFNKTQSYLEVNPTTGYDSARSKAPIVFAKDSVKHRVIELIEQDESLNENGQKKCLKELIETAKDGVKLGVIQTLWKAQGILADGSNQSASNNLAQVVFNDVTVTVNT